MAPVAPTDLEGSTMPGRRPWRRILALEQSGIVNHGQVVTAKILFLVKHSQLHQQMILRAVSELDWKSPARFFRTTR
jgi:hypothetical protein